MKLPENPSKIVGKTYTGQKDDEGRPHGHGIMEYFTSGEKKYKYEGHFEHGVRYGNEDQLDYVIRNKETYIEMGYGDQIEKVWMPLWKKKHPEAKTQVSPSANIIQPSGIASVVEADI